MSATSKTLVPEFGPETRFEVWPAPPPAPYRAELENRFEQLKRRLLAEQLEETWEPELNSALRRAANEAAALAWVTPYPLFFFPALFEEKAERAINVAERQSDVRARSRELLAL
jgi:hypothetical protein